MSPAALPGSSCVPAAAAPRLLSLLLVLMLGLVGTVSAQVSDPTPLQFNDAAEEQRFQDLTAELRCVMCQNQSLADSDAQIAQDLRREVLELMREGRTDAQVKQFLVERYGEFVLYRPPVKGATWLLWFGPFLLLLGGIGFLLMKLVRRPVQEDGLPESDRKRAAALLEDTHNTKEKA